MKRQYQHVVYYVCPMCKHVEKSIEQYYTVAMKPSAPRCCGKPMKKIKHDQSGGI